MARRTPARTAAAALAVAATLGLAACGEEEEPTPLVVDDHPTLVMQASRSLAVPLTECTKQYAPADVRVEVGEAGEIEGRARARRGDLVVADDTALPDRLHDDGVVDDPEQFARDTLVLAVPARGAKVRDFSDVMAGESEGVLGIGDPAVAFGAAFADGLARLTDQQREAVLARVRTSETDARTLVQRVRSGSLDAAIVRQTDVEATDGELRALPLPAVLNPRLTYAAAVVSSSRHAASAAALIDDLQSGICAGDLRAEGFLVP